MQQSTIFSFLISIFSIVEASAKSENCYSKGTLPKSTFDVFRSWSVEEYCPCKFGYTGPKCMDIYECATGELKIASCSEPGANHDLSWRCFLTKKEKVTICQCPDGFSGETCNEVNKKSVSTLYTQYKAIDKFFIEKEAPEGSSSHTVINTTHSVFVAITRVLFFLFFASVLVSIGKKVIHPKKNNTASEILPTQAVTRRWSGAPPKYGEHQKDSLISNQDSEKWSQTSISSNGSSLSSEPPVNKPVDCEIIRLEELIDSPSGPRPPLSIQTHLRNEETNEDARSVERSIVILKKPNLHV